MKLYKIRGFLPYLAIVFFNAFVDLGHKILIQNTLYRSQSAADFTVFSAIINGLILLPYILLFTPSGFIADYFSKTKVLRVTALAVIPIVILITICYYLGLFWWSFGLTLLLAIQSAFNSPAKYGFIKEIFGKDNIAEANGLVQTIAIISILAGTFVFTLLFTFFLSKHGLSSGELVDRSQLLKAFAPSGFLLIIAAGLEAWLTFKLPIKPAADRNSTFHLGNYLTGKNLHGSLKSIRGNTVILTCIIGLAVFWAINQVLLASYGAYLKQFVPGSGELYANSTLAIGGIGVFFGALYAGRISKGFIETGIIPIAAMGLCIGLLLLALITNKIGILLLFLGYGFFGGLLIVPLNSLIQFHAQSKNLGTVLASNNFVQNVFMLTFLLLTVIATRLGLDGRINILILFAIAFLGSIYALKRLPQSLIRYLIFFVVSKFYKVDVNGLNHLPSTGGVLLLGNHTSYLDWALIQIACPRPIHFVIDRQIYETWYLKIFLKSLGVIPISRGGSKEAIESIQATLKAGEIVALFPEGYLSRNGQLGVFQKGFEKAVAGTDAVIIPFYIRGLWGTLVSYATPQYKEMTKRHSRKISLSYGAPMSSEATAAQVKQAVFNLSMVAWRHYSHTLTTIASEWLARAKSMGNKLAIAESSGKQVSHHQLISMVWCLSRQIRKSLKKSSHIGILLPPSIGGALANLALWVLNKTVVNLNYTAGKDSLLQACEMADISVVITSRLFLDRLAKKGFAAEEIFAHKNILYLEDLLKNNKMSLVCYFIAVKLLPLTILKLLTLKKNHHTNDVAAILFSSGSEGKPKGVELTHRNLLCNAKQVSSIAGIENTDVILGCLPLFHAFGLTVTTILPLIEGIPMVCHPDARDAVAIGKLVYQYQITFMASTSTFLNFYCRHHRLHPLLFQSLRLVIAGAEKLSSQVRDAFKQKFGIDVFEGYGATEVAPVASVNLNDMINPDDLHVHVANKTGTVGLPVPGTSFRVVDPVNRQDLPCGEEGMVLIGGAQVMKGYLKNPEKTEQALIRDPEINWYITGDKGKLDEDGFLTIVDRYSRFAKIGGEMISLTATEQVIIDHLSGESPIDLVVVALADERKGETLILLYQAQMTPEELLAKLRGGKIPPLMIPDQAFRVSELPKLGSGKSDFGAAKQLAHQLLVCQ
jgi:acyl-[acyl-carrier-protein]-phospholipid O-acyltransferase / long-chain-fatty-acid--[acyl-carrier-protein] ligase